MPLGTLQHYTIEPSDLDATKSFYCDVLGLEIGYRPPLGFPGYWLYSGGVATVHLLGPRQAMEGFPVRDPREKFDNTGRFDHIAFEASGMAEVKARLEARKVAFQERTVPMTGASQIFLRDPDGIGVELNFAP